MAITVIVPIYTFYSGLRDLHQYNINNTEIIDVQIDRQALQHPQQLIQSKNIQEILAMNEGLDDIEDGRGGENIEREPALEINPLIDFPDVENEQNLEARESADPFVGQEQQNETSLRRGKSSYR
jgi:hypothetical protein